MAECMTKAVFQLSVSMVRDSLKSPGTDSIKPVTRAPSGTGITSSMLTTKAERWRHQMETFSALLALCAGNSPVTGEFPTQRPMTRNFDAFFDLRQWWGWWLRRHRAHYDVTVMSLWPSVSTFRWEPSIYYDTIRLYNGATCMPVCTQIILDLNAS